MIIVNSNKNLIWIKTLAITSQKNGRQLAPKVKEKPFHHMYQLKHLTFYLKRSRQIV